MEKRFDIVTDSACDMPEEYLSQHGVVCVKLGYTMGEENYEGENGLHLEPADFYARVRGGEMPTTSQVTGEIAKTHMEKILQKGRDVMAITFSSALSGTSGSFVVAQRELSALYPDRKIVVVDSLCASMGQGLLLDYALKKAETGASLEETAEYVEDLKLHICHYFTVDNLFHLKRGGRVSTATAIVGSLLKIKPVMHVSNEGKLVPIGKAMGRKKSLHQLVELLVEDKDMDENDPIFISHGDCMEDVEYVKKLLQERIPGVQIYVNYVGPVIGAHSGPGTVAIFNKGKKR